MKAAPVKPPPETQLKYSKGTSSCNILRRAPEQNAADRMPPPENAMPVVFLVFLVVVPLCWIVRPGSKAWLVFIGRKSLDTLGRLIFTDGTSISGITMLSSG